MAIKPANSNYHTFTFNGVRAADYGIYVTDVNVFNSAARDVEYIQMPGRDGAFALDRGRFQNISVVYKCAMTQDTDEDFATAISEFRNAIASTKGYKRLEDDIHTDEYRMGVFSKGLEAPTLNTKTATFDVEFNCQPQRWLKSGEIPRTIGGSVTNTQTKSGSVVSIESDGGDAVTSFVAQIAPKQAGSGDPSPINERPITGWTAANAVVAEKNLLNANLLRAVSNVSISDGIVTATRTDSRAWNPVLQAYKGNSFVRNLAYGIAEFPCTFTKDGTFDTLRFGHSGQQADIKCGFPFSVRDGVFTFSFEMIQSTGLFSWHNMQIELGTTATAYEPYTGNTYPVSFGSAGTVYGGTVDVTEGILTDTKRMLTGTDIVVTAVGTNSAGNKWADIRATGLVAGSTVMCDKYKQVFGSTSASNVLVAYTATITVVDNRFTDVATAQNLLRTENTMFVYELATPQTYQLTAQQVELLTGNNTVWADTGGITLTCGRDPNKLVNPTLYDSHPLLQVWGYGTINMLADDQDSQIVINNDPYGSVLLTNKVAKPSSQVSEFLNKSATELLNINDAVQVSAGSVMSIPFDSRVGTDINITNVSVSKTSTYDMDMSYVTARYGTYFIITFTLPQIDFVYSQTYQFKDSDVNVTVSYTQGGVSKTSSFPVRVHAQSTYSRTRDNISVGLFASIRTDGNDFFINEAKPISSTMQTIYGISTKGPFSNNEDSYIDLDIGEAYREVSGQTVSVNNAVTIPAQLPTLKCGANTITYDNTISQLEVVPRWWEV